MKLLTKMPASFFPFFQQEGMSECAHACVKMIAKYYGIDYEPSEYKRREFVSEKGINLLHLTHTIEEIGLKCEALKGSFKDFIKEGELPCIAYWGKNHFVVVFDYNDHYIQIADPKIGKVILKHQEFISEWATLGSESKEGIIMFVRDTNEIT